MSTKGFTIVELLIVIVVIAILAAITIVAYNGIQNNAYDTAVKNDLRSMAVKIKEYHAIRNDVFPASSGATTAFTDFGPLPVSKNAYEPSTNNIYYCVGTVNGVVQFGLAARGKSGNKWMYTTSGSITNHDGVWTGSGAPCGATGVPTTAADFTYKYGVTSANVWSGWIQ